MPKYPAQIVSFTIVAFCAALFSGCVSGVTRAPDTALSKFSPSASPIGAITIETTPEVQEKLKDSFKFDAQALSRLVEQALSSNSMLAAAQKETAPSLHILVTHVRVRSTFNAMMWGAMSGNDAIHGDIVIKDSSGKILDQFKVTASYALGGFAGGQDSMRMGWLYEAFAKEMVREFSGEKTGG